MKKTNIEDKPMTDQELQTPIPKVALAYITKPTRLEAIVEIVREYKRTCRQALKNLDNFVFANEKLVSEGNVFNGVFVSVEEMERVCPEEFAEAKTIAKEGREFLNALSFVGREATPSAFAKVAVGAAAMVTPYETGAPGEPKFQGVKIEPVK